MHNSVYEAMAEAVATFVPEGRRLKVVDLGSATTEERLGRGQTHRSLFAGYDASIIGLDVVDGPNVDRVMERPYRLPQRTNSVDVVVSGQVFEHIPYFWASMFEVARILKPGGIFLMSVPSRGHKHMFVDCWRVYSDGIRAMAAFTGLDLLHAKTDYPRVEPETNRRFWKVQGDVKDPHYWGDTVGVFRKPMNYPTRRMALVRTPIRVWANRQADAFTELANREDALRSNPLAPRKPARAQAKAAVPAAVVDGLIDRPAHQRPVAATQDG